MNTIKIILAAVGLIAIVLLAYALIGIISSVVWYLFVIGVVAVIGVGGYKLLKRADAPQLESKPNIAISEMENADRTLEEYKQKYLPK